MPDTPGRRAYAVYRQERARVVVLPPWEALTPDHQYAWEAAAQAVRAMVVPTPERPAVTAAVAAAQAVLEQATKETEHA